MSLDLEQHLKTVCDEHDPELDLYSRLTRVRKSADYIWQDQRLKWFTDHRARTHSRYVIQHLGKILEHLQTSHQRLNPHEIFVLLVACYLHDIGMQDFQSDAGRSVDQFDDEDYKRIRKTHPERSKELIIKRTLSRGRDEFQIDLDDDAQYLVPIALVSQGHGSDYFVRTVKEFDDRPHRPGNMPLRGGLLTSLLLMGDELDLHERRATFPKEFSLSAVSLLHHHMHHYVTGVEIIDGRTPKHRRIRLTFEFPKDSDEYRMDVKEWITRKLKKQIELTNTIVEKFTEGELIWDDHIDIRETIDEYGVRRSLLAPENEIALNELRKLLSGSEYTVKRNRSIESISQSYENAGRSFPKAVPSVLSDPVDTILSRELHEALTAFSSQPKVWVEPVLSTCAEIEGESENDKRVSVSDLVVSPKSTLIKAPPQFGLTCLARNFVLQAWRLDSPARWLYLDVRSIKPNQRSIEKAALSELSSTGHTLEEVRCVVLDSWQITGRSAYRVLRSICDCFSDIPVFVMQTVDARGLLSPFSEEEVGRTFDVLYLWALSREHIRGVVSTYNEERHIGDEDAVTSRIISDIDALNIHRTPLNCLTVLKASEVDFSESPVNRTEMLGRVLFVLFNVDTSPTYKLRPDMKDCEFVLGYFCEQLIRTENYFFPREQFLEMLRSFCAKRVMAMDIETLFDILHESHIIIPFGSLFCFKFAYWLYYFAAQRMHHDDSFAEYILSDSRYARFPELIEFYTGIDRRRKDALQVLTEDLQRGIGSVREKCGLPDELNPYPFIQWQPSASRLEEMREEIRNGVESSNLPDVIKDRYADRRYDRSRPYNQEVRNVLNTDSFISVFLTMSAAARALRNSDYVDPAYRLALLHELLQGWRQITQVLWVLLPLLSERAHASFDGIKFLITDSFGETFAERFRRILMEIPYNIVTWYKDDLFSPKMAPLLYRQIEKEEDEVIRHEMILLIIAKRPPGWRAHVERYINEIHKNSYYLYDISRYLRAVYLYEFLPHQALKDTEYLIKMSLTKHVHGIKRPGITAVKKVPDSVLPKRPAETSINTDVRK